MLGFNNIELITDRSLEINLREITQVKKDWPDRAMIVSLMLPCEEALWAEILPLVEATGADGIELNFGCPHGMPERGMGAAVGQVPEYVEMVTRWCKKHSKLPVIVKLTPNITDVRAPARAALAGGADAVSLINTINSITHLDLDRMVAFPVVGNASTHGGYCGSAVKPIALNMVAEIARDPQTANLPISGIGGIGNWRDAAEFIALGAGSVQVCTAAMLHGFRIVEEMKDGLSRWMDEKGYENDRGLHAQGRAQHHRLEIPGHELPGHRPDRPGQVHQVRQVLRRLRRHLAPVDRPADRRRQRVRTYEVIKRGVRGLQSVRNHLPGRDPALPWCRRRPASRT